MKPGIVSLQLNNSLVDMFVYVTAVTKSMQIGTISNKQLLIINGDN